MTATCDTRGRGKDLTNSTERTLLDRAYMPVTLAWIACMAAASIWPAFVFDVLEMAGLGLLLVLAHLLVLAWGTHVAK